MKRIVYSLFTISALSMYTFAGGNIAPVEEVIEPQPTPVVVEEDHRFYAGVAYGYIDYDLEKTVNSGGNRSSASRDTSHNSVMFQGGYKYNRYISFEGRYWLAQDEDFIVGGLNRTKTIDAWGIYLKPIYPMFEDIDIYALLGYAHINTDFIAYRANGTANVQNLDDNGFSWGAGLSYKINDDFSAFVDFVRLYDDKQTKYLAAPLVGTKDWDMTIDTYNVGVTYKF